MHEAQLEVRWETVDEIVRQYRLRRPDEYLGAVEYAKILRRQYEVEMNSTAVVDKNSSRRHLCELPVFLVNAIETLFPLALQEDNLIKFLKRHPQFCIPSKL